MHVYFIFLFNNKYYLFFKWSVSIAIDNVRPLKKCKKSSSMNTPFPRPRPTLYRYYQQYLRCRTNAVYTQKQQNEQNYYLYFKIMMVRKKCAACAHPLPFFSPCLFLPVYHSPPLTRPCQTHGTSFEKTLDSP